MAVAALSTCPNPFALPTADHALLPTLSCLHASDLAASAQASSSFKAAAEQAAAALVACLWPAHVGARQPPGVSWIRALALARDVPRLLVLGGENQLDEPLLNPELLEIMRTPPRVRTLRCRLRRGRYRAAAARLGRYVYITGGADPEGNVSTEVLVFDVLTHDWASSLLAPVMRSKRHGHAALGIWARFLIVLGGKPPEGATDSSTAQSVEIFDTARNRWYDLPPMNEPRVYFGAAFDAVNGMVVVCGGISPGQGKPLRSTEVLDLTQLPKYVEAVDQGNAPPEIAWHWGPPLQFPRYDFSLAGPLNGHLYAVGGSHARRLVETLPLHEVVTAAKGSPSGGYPSGGAEGDASAGNTRELLLSEGWADVHSLSAAIRGALSGWQLHRVELPEAHSCVSCVAAGNYLFLVGGSQRSILRFEPHRGLQWQPTGAQLPQMRLGLVVVSLLGGDDPRECASVARVFG